MSKAQKRKRLYYDEGFAILCDARQTLFLSLVMSRPGVRVPRSALLFSWVVQVNYVKRIVMDTENRFGTATLLGRWCD